MLFTPTKHIYLFTKKWLTSVVSRVPGSIYSIYINVLKRITNALNQQNKTKHKFWLEIKLTQIKNTQNNCGENEGRNMWRYVSPTLPQTRTHTHKCTYGDWRIRECWRREAEFALVECCWTNATRQTKSRQQSVYSLSLYIWLYIYSRWNTDDVLTFYYVYSDQPRKKSAKPT